MSRLAGDFRRRVLTSEGTGQPREISTTPDADLFDFGPVLARGQTLRHEFTLSNPTDRPIRVLGAEAMTPCCSTVESFPETIPPRGSAKLAVTLNPEFRKGRKRAGFLYKTDEDSGVVRELTLVANFVPEVDDALVDGTNSTLPIRQSGRQSIRFVFHRRGEEGRGEPSSVEAKPPLSARFAAPSEHRALTDGLSETIRLVEVNLPASDEPGVRRGALTLHWPDGKTWDREIEWKVVPRIVATPSGLTLRAGEAKTVAIVLKAEDRPFRTLRVDGEILADGYVPPGEASKTQVLSIPLNAAKAARDGPVDLKITTDHPDEPAVNVSVLIIPSQIGGQP